MSLETTVCYLSWKDETMKVTDDEGGCLLSRLRVAVLLSPRRGIVPVPNVVAFPNVSISPLERLTSQASRARSLNSNCCIDLN
jgi:hypothetical protein